MPAPKPTDAAALFVTFEGVEGAGKTTQIERLAGRLRRAGVDPVVTREPGGTALGQRLRELLLRPMHESWDPAAELLLYAADRAQHLVEVIEPALGQGRLVICDRYLDATLAYQGYGRSLGAARILDLHRLPPLDRRPQRTVLLDIEPDQSVPRARRRSRGNGLEASGDRFEQEAFSFHKRVRDGYLQLAASEPDRIRVVDASGSADEVELRVAGALRDVLPALESSG